MDKGLLRRAANNHRVDILQPYDQFMELEGFDVIYELCDYFGGSTVYIPQARSIFKRCLELDALKEFNGANYQALVRKYGMSETHLRRIIHKGS